MCATSAEAGPVPTVSRTSRQASSSSSRSSSASARSGSWGLTPRTVERCTQIHARLDQLDANGDVAGRWGR